METTKVFSLRVSDRLIDTIALKIVHLRWWTRNAFITAILQNLLDNASDEDIKRLVCHHRCTKRKLVISIREEEIS